MFVEKWCLREFYWMFSWMVGDDVLGDGCLMLGVDEVLLWVLGVDVLGVRCLMLGIDEVLSWVLDVDVLGGRC